jgi:hypothetical protein
LRWLMNSVSPSSFPCWKLKALERFVSLALIPRFPLLLNLLGPSYFLGVLGCCYPIGDLG